MLPTESYTTSNALRGLAYRAIDSERNYQDEQRGNAKRHTNMSTRHMTPGEIILCAEHCLADARTAWYAPEGGTNCLPFLRKVAALCVQAMERYGAPTRPTVNERISELADGGRHIASSAALATGHGCSTFEEGYRTGKKSRTANLGLASTGELLSELAARARVNGYDKYKPVDGTSVIAS